MGQDDCFTAALLIYSGLIFIGGILPYFQYTQDDSLQLEALNWSQDMINDLEIIKPEDDCSQGFQPVLSYQWSGLKEGCYCADKKFYDTQTCQRQIKKQSCLTLPLINPKSFQYYVLTSYQDDIKSVQGFKICGKKILSFQQLIEKPLEEYCIGGSEERCIIDNSAFCISDFDSCPIPQNICSRQEKTCTINEIYKICITKNKQCPEVFICDSENQKPCFAKDKIFCIDRNEKCPITNLYFISKGKEINRKKYEDIEQIQLKINFDYELFVDRNKKGIPIVDFVLSSADGVCLDDQSRIPVKYYTMDKRGVCYSLDDRYIPVVDQSAFSTDVYKINNVDLGTHEDLIPKTDKFDMYFRRFYDSQYDCKYQIDLNHLQDMFESIVSFSNYLFKFSMTGFIFLIIGIYYFLTNDSKMMILYIPLVIAFINVILFMILDGNIQEIDISLSQYENEKCYDKILISQISQLRGYVSGGAMIFVNIIYFPLVIYIKIMGNS